MTIHLHRPTSPAPVCGAPVPQDRRNGLTAYRSDITCPDCLATLRPLPPTIVTITWPPEFDRTPETFGPFDNEDAAEEWLDTLVPEGTILDEATFIITRMDRPFDWSSLSNDASGAVLC